MAEIDASRTDPLKRALEKLDIILDDPERASEELEELAATYVALVTARRELRTSARSSRGRPRLVGD
jgi:hypothetical protein